jgi:hypothetical protein
VKTNFFVAAMITVTYAPPAVADFYVIENQATHKCTIVSQNYKPMPDMTERVVGNSVYNNRQEAEVAMRTDKACSSTPMGGGIATPNAGGGNPPRPYR